MTRQRTWQKRMVAAGRCRQCGGERLMDGPATCVACSRRHSEYNRQCYLRTHPEARAYQSKWRTA